MNGEAGNPHTGLEIGRTLRLAREKRGLSLQQVEEATKIRIRYLRDLENENFDVLPAVYILGSLKTYAEHLGLDGAAITGTGPATRRSSAGRAAWTPGIPEPSGWHRRDGRSRHDGTRSQIRLVREPCGGSDLRPGHLLRV
jgi:hypothetical protein